MGHRIPPTVLDLWSDTRELHSDAPPHAGVQMIQTDDKGHVRVSSMLMATSTVERKVARMRHASLVSV